MHRCRAVRSRSDAAPALPWRRLQPAGPCAGGAPGNLPAWPARTWRAAAATVTISGAAAAMPAACPGPVSP
jgi:hypothetical protein